MRDRITKEMISDETDKRCMDAARNVQDETCSNGFDSKMELSAILNAAMQDPNIRAAFVAEAIERGEASPPGWITRDQYGNIDRIYDGTIVVRATRPSWKEQVEHWKGQK